MTHHADVMFMYASGRATTSSDESIEVPLTAKDLQFDTAGLMLGSNTKVKSDIVSKPRVFRCNEICTIDSLSCIENGR